jgi:4-methylaminobutanoate oxidase (formaldehyde-forming)
MGYVSAPAGALADRQYVLSGSYEIEVAGERVPARVSLEPWYDPKSARVRS